MSGSECWLSDGDSAGNVSQNTHIWFLHVIQAFSHGDFSRVSNLREEVGTGREGPGREVGGRERERGDKGRVRARMHQLVS